MARSKQQRLDDVKYSVEHARHLAAKAQKAEEHVTLAMLRARKAGLSLRAIAAVADVSDVTVLNRTRDEMPDA